MTTIVATLILNSLSGGDETQTVNTTVSAAETTVQELTTDVPDDRPRLFITTYIWQDGEWVEHASWLSDTSESSWVPVVSAWNWSPEYPALTVRFDDFLGPETVDDFEASPVSRGQHPVLMRGRLPANSKGA